MEKKILKRGATEENQARRYFLFFLLTLFLLTTCPIKRSISQILFDNAGIEHFGLNDHKRNPENESLVFKGSPSCSAFEMVNSAKVSFQSVKVPLPIFLISLAFLLFLPASYLNALFGPAAAFYFKKSLFLAAPIPIYIRNRRLLIWFFCVLPSSRFFRIYSEKIIKEFLTK